MPTPVELITDPVSLCVFALYGALVCWEALAPARRLPAVKGWRLRGLFAFMFYFLLSSYLPLAWAEHLASLRLFDLSAAGTWGGAGIGLFVYQALVYGWHRAMHTWGALWRTFHQMHHSAERLDTFGAFWFSPLDMIGWTVLFSLSMTLAGFTPQAVTLVLLITTFLSVFQHANIRTPRWLGYIVQRPESHSRHHARDLHAGNYGDLPVFDMLFGTFHNPPDFSAEAGFYPGASARIVDMLLFRDVSKPRS
ncbi:sterol desaturase/sphingolipid hydroxylase (fatty acid hydroxylase superfamily) [Paraburkholderia sp. BL8N3]|jgi:sterol desaturase/sphingolipid hydroxylase (fatty acid hydroxylase superfamily)|nr:sterol desaturase family protein [Paraburkholderia sp. BL8N3]TCK39277.1 sterol desaturase/sphingolipid hydroxylase (fatty acid hydroxylase superfamily) [Paraburkholderia sp. BL8N3]